MLVSTLSLLYLFSLTRTSNHIIVSFPRFDIQICTDAEGRVPLSCLLIKTLFWRTLASSQHLLYTLDCFAVTFYPPFRQSLPQGSLSCHNVLTPSATLHSTAHCLSVLLLFNISVCISRRILRPHYSFFSLHFHFTSFATSLFVRLPINIKLPSLALIWYAC